MNNQTLLIRVRAGHLLTQLTTALWLIFFLFLSFSIKAQDESLPTKESAQAVCVVKISFGSSGGGIDGKTYDEIRALIESKKLKFSEKKMGREGESELCLTLAELKKKKRKQFIAQLKKTAAKGQLVSVSES